jgi:hypothetical protein
MKNLESYLAKCEPQANMNFDAFCRHVQTTMEAKVGIDMRNKP